VPKNSKKIEEKMGFFWRIGFSGNVGEKGEIGVFGWPTVGGYGGKWPEVVSRWGVVVGVGGFGFREEKDGGGVG
jgi:hypothetical protein